MKRRGLLTVATTTVSLASIAGCSADGNDSTGLTYTLAFSELDDEVAARPLDFDTAGLAAGQETIVEKAVRNGSYSEENVNWDSMPGQEGITMEFRTVIQMIARHLDRDPTVTDQTSFETPSRYGGRRYRATVDVS